MPLVRPSRFRVIRRRAAVPDEMRGQHSQEMSSEDGLSTKFFELPLPRPEHRLESPRYKLPPRPAITGTGKPSRIPCEALAAISALRNATIKIKTIPTWRKRLGRCISWTQFDGTTVVYLFLSTCSQQLAPLQNYETFTWTTFVSCFCVFRQFVGGECANWTFYDVYSSRWQARSPPWSFSLVFFSESRFTIPGNLFAFASCALCHCSELSSTNRGFHTQISNNSPSYPQALAWNLISRPKIPGEAD